MKKMNLKKKLMILLAAGIMLLSAPFAFAEPTEGETDSAAPVVTQAPISNTQTTQSAVALTNDIYLTKGAAAIWFILVFVASGAFSFWIGNRFYRLAKKDNHVQAEIRALRRDIEDKFTKSIDGITEQEIDIENINDIFALKDEGIKTPQKRRTIKELSPEEEERFRQWEEAQSKPKTERTRTARPAAKSTLREELEEDFDDVKVAAKKDYKPEREERPTRTRAPKKEAEPSENMDETRVIKPVGEGVKNKAKELLSDIFPFNED